VPGSRKLVAGHQLYYFSTCPFCIIVRLALWWLGLRLSLKEVMFDADNGNDLTAGGGKFQVPCLRIESADGKVRWMYESIDIIRYLKNDLAT